MDISKCKIASLISYIPLLWTPPNHMVIDELTPDNIDDFEAFLNNRHGGNAIACIWVHYEGHPSPVFAYEEATEIVEHLKVWTEDAVTDWFKVCIHEKGEKYTITLMPNVEKSVERWKMNFQLVHKFPPPKDMKYHILFKPLHFVSGASTTYHLIKADMADSPYVGFINMNDVDIENPSNMDGHITWIGPFKRMKPGWAAEYLECILDDAQDPKKKSVLFDPSKELQRKKRFQKKTKRRRK
jgi:hypothetical protein